MNKEQKVFLVIVVVFLMIFAFAGGFVCSSVTKAQISQEVMKALRVNRLLTNPAGDDSKYFGILYEALDYLKERYVEPGKVADERELAYGAVKGMLKVLEDPYTRFMDPKDYKRFQEENVGRFGGIGAGLLLQFFCPYCHNQVKIIDVHCKYCGGGLRYKESRVVVVSVLSGTPASRAGLKPGDWVIKVGDKFTRDMEYEDIIGAIRGDVGTAVTLTMGRGVGEKREEFEVTIIRAIIDVSPLYYKVLQRDSRIGYIQLKQFNDKAVKELDNAINDLKGRKTKGLILDVRNNPGGLLEVAVDAASRFISQGPIVSVKERGRMEKVEYARDSKTRWLAPLVVLVNSYSASGSEILAGAVKDRKVGKVVGTTTFGKGTVQGVYELSDGSAVAITSAKYFTPFGTDIQDKGIKPDVVVEVAEGEKKDLQLDEAIKLVQGELVK